MLEIYSDLERSYLNLCRYIDDYKGEDLSKLKAVSYQIHINLIELRNIKEEV